MSKFPNGTRVKVQHERYGTQSGTVVCLHTNYTPDIGTSYGIYRVVLDNGTVLPHVRENNMEETRCQITS